MYFKNLCIGCRECIEVCPKGVQTIDIHNKINRELCNRCGSCVKSCYPEALKIVGMYMSVEEVLMEIKKDELFYKNSGGGITVSGGEPTMQLEFSLKLFKASKERGYHTTLDTCGYVEWKILKRLLSDVDLVLFDLKHVDSKKHSELTGGCNELILENLKMIDKMNQEYIVRIPSIPGFNDSLDDIFNLARFIADLKNIKRTEILPYHKFGVSKYEHLGRRYDLKDLEPPATQHLQKIDEIMRNSGLNVFIESLS
jgi:pyruvate formate lyase activating enzyme